MYLGSSLSNLRSRSLTSGGISGGCSGFSCASASTCASPSATCASSFLSSPFSVVASAAGAFFLGRGVAARLGCSSSSPMTKSGSNSEGSGPFPAGAALLLSPSLDRAVRFEGDRLRELERRAVAEFDREGLVCWAACWAAFWRACSSAIASIAPRMRCLKSAWRCYSSGSDVGTWNMMKLFYKEG